MKKKLASGKISVSLELDTLTGSLAPGSPESIVFSGLEIILYPLGSDVFTPRGALPLIVPWSRGNEDQGYSVGQ
jgi:hypothetical protein